jgi:hypothetical protein
LSNVRFDFTAVFTKIGDVFVRGLKLRIKRQTGIDGQRYSRPELSTLKARQRMLSGTHSAKKGTTLGITTKGKVRKIQAVGVKGLTNVPITRMLVSQDTANRGFESTATKDRVRVFVSEQTHIKMGGNKTPTFAQLIDWNSKGQSNVNPHVKRPPLMFPSDAIEITMMEKEMDAAQRLFAIEASKQMNQKATMKLKRILHIG